MSRPLRAERYAKNASPTLISIIREKLPYFSYHEAHEFYRQALPHLKDSEVALLGCNDRYFLLTGPLGRVDACHPWLYDRCREVEARPDGYLDLWARFHFKSTIITFAGGLQEALIDPEIRIGIFSIDKDVSGKFLSQIKEEVESNDDLRLRYYPDVLWANPKREAPSWSVSQGLTFKRKGNPKECTFEAHGLIRALPTGSHFPLLIFDDAINENNVTNPDQIRKATERFELADNLGILEGSRKWFIGTRYHFADTYGHIIEHDIAIPRIYPATDNGKLDGNPVLMSEKAWKERMKAQRGTIAAQMLQNPLAGKENVFFTKWLRPFELRPLTTNIYILGDPSLGRSATSDRTAISVQGIDPNGNKYLLDGYCHRMPQSERWKKLKELYRKWKSMPGVQRIEVGWERYGMQSDLEYFQEQMRKDKSFFEIEEVSWVSNIPDQSKKTRVSRLEPDFRLSNYYVPMRVWHPDVGGAAIWSIDEETDEIHYRPNPGPTRMERVAVGRGERWRIMEPLRRVDEDGNIYDLVRVFFEEFRFFPFSPRDDLIDTMSRIYDMDPIAPKPHETVIMENYVDA